MQAPENIKETLEQFKQGPGNLEDAIAGLSDQELDYIPANGGWSIRQILHHITDGDDLWKIGIKMALGNDQAEFSLKWYLDFTQVEWSKKWNYESRPIDVSLNFLKATREHIVQLIEHSSGSWNKAVKLLDPNEKIETIPIGFIIKMQTDHLLHHVKRIKEIRQEIKTNKL